MILRVYSFLLIVQVTYAKCPLSCQCYEQSATQSMFCVQASLSSIPNSFDFKVKIFNFTGNCVPVLQNEAFRNPDYANVEILDLKNNHIRTIATKALHRLTNLLEIDLSNNHIRLINSKMFKKNRFLNTLRLSGNPIEQIRRYAFPPLIYLQRMDFQGCKLKKISRSAFINTPSLENLNLKDNALKYAPTKAVSQLTRLSILQLDNNPLRCDENLWHLLKWLQYRNATSHTYLLCVYGETENAVFWDTMDANDVNNKFKNIRDKRAIRNAKIVSVKERVSGAKAQQYQREYTPKRNIIITTPKHHIEPDYYNCTQYNEYSPVKDNNPKNNTTTATTTERASAAAATGVITAVKKEKHLSSLSSLPKLQNATSPVRYNNAKVVKNYVDPIKNHVVNKFTSPNVARAISDHDEAVQFTLQELNATGNETSLQYQQAEEQNLQDNQIGSFLEENHTAVIIVEVMLIIILLAILYKIWREGRERYEQGLNVPLNNGNKKVKSYDTQTSEYKRYSLSDEEYSDIRNDNDEGKCDAESGYLSYHRYNSIEGENNNDYVYYRRYYGNENEDNLQQEINDEVFANHIYPSSNEQSVGTKDFSTNTISRHNSASRRSRKEHSAQCDHTKSKSDIYKNHSSDDDNNN